MTAFEVRALHVYYGDKEALKDINIDIPEKKITTIIGPSGCGKSTFLRCLNLMIKEIPYARTEGEVIFDGENVLEYKDEADIIAHRRRVGTVFQHPNPFPWMSIYDNVAYGLRLMGMDEDEIEDRVYEALEKAALLDQVEDRLDDPASALSGGQQQRLCIARALAMRPEVLLMDEPTSDLDPIATRKIEETVMELKGDVTIVFVTHLLPQAYRIGDYTAFFLHGELVEANDTKKLFTDPQDERTKEYIEVEFGPS
ncbi:phosphate ABC transporter ATP-binding protein PstB [Methanopyrus sp.]